MSWIKPIPCFKASGKLKKLYDLNDEINQVVSYFCYANRTVLGLGVNTNNERDTGNWEHK